MTTPTHEDWLEIYPYTPNQKQLIKENFRDLITDCFHSNPDFNPLSVEYIELAHLLAPLMGMQNVEHMVTYTHLALLALGETSTVSDNWNFIEDTLAFSEHN